MNVRVEQMPAAELVAALYAAVRRRRRADSPVSRACEAWLESGPPQEHPAVAMTLALWALGFGLSSAFQMVLHHGPMPAFALQRPYSERLKGRVPVRRMAELFELPPTDRMRRKLQMKRHAKRYRLRVQTVEPVFGQIKATRGFRQFNLRGLSAVQAEWLLVFTVHNLMKLYDARRAG